MKVSVDDLRNAASGGATEGGGEVAAEAGGEVAEAAGEMVEGGTPTGEGIIDVNEIVNEEVGGIIEEQVRESIVSSFQPTEEKDSGPSMAEALKEIAEMAKDPEIREMAKTAWYGSEGNRQNPPPPPQNQSQTKQVEQSQEQSHLEAAEIPENMNTEKAYQTLKLLLETIAEENPDMTIEEMQFMSKVMVESTGNIGTMKPGVSSGEVNDFVDSHEAQVKTGLASIIEGQK